LITIIKPRYEEILEMSLHAIENSGYSEIARRNVVLTGGTTHLTGSLEIAERVLDCSVRLGMPTKLGGLSENTSGPSFSSCAGVIIHALDQKKNELKHLKKRSSFTQKIIKNLMGTGF
jgi:cell division protein FtsA